MKRVYFRLVVLLFIAFSPALAAHAEEVALTARLDRNPISLEDQAILTISVSGADNAPAPTLPSLPDFDVASNGRSTRVSIVNGSMSSQTDYAFVLQPKKTGGFLIGPATMQYKGKTYHSEPITLHVAKGGSAESGGKDLFITTEVDRTSPYVGEQIMFRLKFFRKVNVANATLGDLTFDGFQAADAGKETVTNTVVNGVGYQVTELRRMLIPSRAGTITIPAAALQCQVPVESHRRPHGGFFGDEFFGLQRTTAKTLRSQPISVHVRPLPQDGKPSAFSGMVGTFHLTAELDKKSIKKGESSTLTVKIAGKGDLTGAPRPALLGIEQFKTYDDQPVASKKIDNYRIVSEKIFKTALVPLYAGDLKPLEVSFWYFDPAAGTYRKASASVPGLHVLPSDSREDTRVVEGQAPAAVKQNVEIVNKDILPINTDIHALKDEAFRLPDPQMSVMFLLPPLAYVVVFLIKKKQDRFSTDSGYARSSNAMKQARKRLEEAVQLSQGTDPRQCLALLTRTFKSYLGDKLNVTGDAMTPEEIKEILQRRMGQIPLVERAEKLLRELEMRQFAPIGNEGTDASGKVIQEIRELIQQMEKTL